MWSFLSFSGRWEPKHLAELPPVQSNAPTAEQMQKTRVAVEARTRYRQGKALALHVEQKRKQRRLRMMFLRKKTVTSEKKTKNFLLGTTMTA